MKTAPAFLEDANKTVTRISAQDAVARHADSANVFVDVRDSSDIAKSGTIKGAHRVPRGFLEFAASHDMQFHNPIFQKDAALHLVCGAGGQAALAGKTLQEMGFTNVTNVGGIGDWKAAGGAMED